MRFRTDFVTNSSSSNFIIINTTNDKKTLVDFVKENPQLIQEFVDRYDWHKEDQQYSQENLIESAKDNNMTLHPGDNSCTFGDEQRTLVGEVFDYILRDGGRSKSFIWLFESYNR